MWSIWIWGNALEILFWRLYDNQRTIKTHLQQNPLKSKLFVFTACPIIQHITVSLESLSSRFSGNTGVMPCFETHHYLRWSCLNIFFGAKATYIFIFRHVINTHSFNSSGRQKHTKKNMVMAPGAHWRSLREDGRKMRFCFFPQWRFIAKRNARVLVAATLFSLTQIIFITPVPLWGTRNTLLLVLQLSQIGQFTLHNIRNFRPYLLEY